MTAQEKVTRIAVVLEDAIKDLGKVPSGHLYAHLMGVISLEDYQAAIDLLTKAGVIKVRGHLITYLTADPEEVAP